MEETRELSLTSDSIARLITYEEQERYEDFVGSQNFNRRARKTLDVSVNKSNLFKVIVLNQMGIRVANSDDIETIVHSRPYLLSDREETIPSVVLRGRHEPYLPNELIYKSLRGMIKSRYYNSPTMIFSGLRVVGNDSDEVYGLGFEEGDDFKIVESRELSFTNHKNTFSVINGGIPMIDPQYVDPVLSQPRGPRIFYSKISGVSPLSISGKGMCGFPVMFARWHYNLRSGTNELDEINEGPVIVVERRDNNPYNSWRE